jgi:rod shape-determining protein MreC
MRRVSYRPYLFLVLFFFCLMSLPQGASERIRSCVVCSFSPCWRSFSLIKERASLLFALPFPGAAHSPADTLELERLSQENQLLHTQIENVREWLLYEDRIQEQVARYKTLSQANFTDPFWQEFFKRRSQELCQALDLQICSLPAKVIFREPASWSSTLWINLGEKDNEKFKKEIIGMNSPVLLGTSIVGVVEYVGKNQSRVRLITDSRLAPSVRVCRGNEQNRYLLEHLESLVFALELREDLFNSPEERAGLSQHLHHLKNNLLQQSGDFYLAKGELHGTSHPLWRSRSHTLKGIGFNYDFPDDEGPARDLRSGEPYDLSRKGELITLLRPGDLLVTTGLDGVFPPGFPVAIVSSVQTLKEGASSYEIEAVSTAGNLDELTHVFVLPPSMISSKDCQKIGRGVN